MALRIRRRVASCRLSSSAINAWACAARTGRRVGTRWDSAAFSLVASLTGVRYPTMPATLLFGRSARGAASRTIPVIRRNSQLPRSAHPSPARPRAIARSRVAGAVTGGAGEAGPVGARLPTRSPGTRRRCHRRVPLGRRAARRASRRRRWRAARQARSGRTGGLRSWSGPVQLQARRPAVPVPMKAVLVLLVAVADRRPGSGLRPRGPAAFTGSWRTGSRH